MKTDSELRQKYLDALERLEAGEARWSQLENALRLIIGRLCLAARGRSEQLDDELRSIGERVRQELSAAQLESCLEPLSRAVAALDSAPPAPQPVAQPTPQSASQPESATGSERELRVHAALAGMLERLAMLPELRPALAELEDRAIADLTPDELAEGLERMARLIGEQRAILAREKLETEELLRQIDARLEDISSYLAGQTEAFESAQESTQQLNLLVLDEVHELNADVERSQDLPQLRGRVRERLDSINSHLQEFRAREEQRLTGQMSDTGRMRMRIAELERETHALSNRLQHEQQLSMLDALTGIPNRAAYDDRIAHEFRRWQLQEIPVSILAWDIDRFKAVNDAYGHRAGDKVLRVIAQHLAQHVRGTDFVARYGGEEFVMILVGTTAEQALIAADKIRSVIAKIGFHFRNKPVTVTASCGITAFVPEDTPDSAFDRADRALYRAKDAGRNCCRIL
jgi:diguanylate cyclase